MNWFKKAYIKMELDWDTAYKELLRELGRVPTPEEVRKRMTDEKDPSFTEFSDPKTNYKPWFDSDLEFK